MRLKLIYLALFFMLPAGAASAADDEKCLQKPEEVQTYLRDHKDVSLTTIDDLLDPESRELWHESARKGLCPGFAVSDMDGSGRKWYGLALLYKKDGKASEKLVLLSPGAGGLKEQTLYDEPVTGEPQVVWHNGPGEYFDYNTDRTFHISHDTIMYDRIEKTTTAYYLENGKLRSALTSD